VDWSFKMAGRANNGFSLAEIWKIFFAESTWPNELLHCWNGPLPI
jgi:hypothetical protein